MNIQKRFLLTSCCLAVLGFAFYLSFRFDLVGSQNFLSSNNVSLLFIDSLPSFVFILMMTFLSASFVGVSKSTRFTIPATWLALTVFMEYLQSIPGHFVLFSGTFDFKDLIALVLGAFISFLALNHFAINKSQQRSQNHQRNQKVVKTSLLVFGAILSIASNIGPNWGIEYDDHEPTDYYYSCTFPDGNVAACEVTPVYLPFTEIRDNDSISFSAENANEDTQTLIDAGADVAEFSGLRVPGKIYVHGDYLFINDRLKGVYIFDNTDPESPTFIGFINVLGSTDMEVLNNVMYVNSFTDLVAIEMQPPYNMQRTEDLFEYPDTNDWLPEGAYFYDTKENSYITIRQDYGIVIGYDNELGNRFFFWDIEL